ncbi:hypothetical protein Salat_0525100 [Sesamum alatum]|uniref:Uncharacterized protein n=1 Tax=Sesamum alatum TaxID=300844 RepID=A0AAE2CTJ2_9LAMI|nr:hypothetical protein Salat_0525100 [Sesamum alatum]
MISGNQPVRAMSYIVELRLFWTVFTLPPQMEPSVLEGCERFLPFCIAQTSFAYLSFATANYSSHKSRLGLCHNTPSPKTPALASAMCCLHGRHVEIFEVSWAVYHSEYPVHPYMMICHYTVIAAILGLLQSYTQIKKMVAPESGNQLHGDSTTTEIAHVSHDNHQRLCLYAALLLPLRNAVCRDKKEREVVRMHLAVEKFVSLIPSIVTNDNLQIVVADWKTAAIDVSVASEIRILTGLLLREIKEFWRATLVLCLLLYPNDIGSSGSLSNENTELKERTELYDRVEKAIIGKGLEGVWELKPLVEGRGIMDILQLNPGPVVGEWQQKVLHWQLAHPSGSPEECKEWMNQTLSKRARTE